MEHLETTSLASFVESLAGTQVLVLMANSSVGMVAYTVEELEAEVTFSYTMNHPFEIEGKLLKSIVVSPDHRHSAAVDRELVTFSHRSPLLRVSRDPVTGAIEIRTRIPLFPSKGFISEARDHAHEFMDNTVLLVNGLIYALQTGQTSYEIQLYVDKYVFGQEPKPPTNPT